MNKDQLSELLYQTLETTVTGMQVYSTAIPYAHNTDLKQEWQTCLRQRQANEKIIREVLARMGLDPGIDTLGRQILRHMGTALIEAMTLALKGNNSLEAQLVATESVEMIETKNHRNWELIGLAAVQVQGEEGQALKEAYERVLDAENERLYLSMGWTRGLWLDSLGLQTVLPPSPEVKVFQTGVAQPEHVAQKLML